MTMLAEKSVETAMRFEMTRVFRASRERIFEAMTNPAQMQQWWGPTSVYCVGAQADVRIGGRYSVSMQRPGETTVLEAVGSYTEVQPPEKLSYTFAGTWNPEEKSLVEITLREVAEGTEMRMVMSRHDSEASLDGHRHGWEGAFTKLETMLAG